VEWRLLEREEGGRNNMTMKRKDTEGKKWWRMMQSSEEIKIQREHVVI
jgi:hypothetical protein